MPSHYFSFCLPISRFLYFLPPLSGPSVVVGSAKGLLCLPRGFIASEPASRCPSGLCSLGVNQEQIPGCCSPVTENLLAPSWTWFYAVSQGSGINNVFFQPLTPPLTSAVSITRGAAGWGCSGQPAQLCRERTSASLAQPGGPQTPRSLDGARPTGCAGPGARRGGAAAPQMPVGDCSSWCITAKRVP